VRVGLCLDFVLCVCLGLSFMCSVLA